MGEHKKTLATTLDTEEREWVESPLQVLPTPAAVIRECVIRVRRMVLAGRMRWPMREGQGLDSEDSKAPAVQQPEKAGRRRGFPFSGKQPPRSLRSVSRRYSLATAEAVVGSVLVAYPCSFPCGRPL